MQIAARSGIRGAESSTIGDISTRTGIAETLVNADESGQLTPGPAIGWEMYGDGLIWTFILRDEVTFHDGSEMMAETVVNAPKTARGTPGPPADQPITDIIVGAGP